MMKKAERGNAGMRLSGNLTDNLITLAVCVGILITAGIVYQIQQHREQKEKEKIESFKQKQNR